MKGLSSIMIGVRNVFFLVGLSFCLWVCTPSHPSSGIAVLRGLSTPISIHYRGIASGHRSESDLVALVDRIETMVLERSEGLSKTNLTLEVDPYTPTEIIGLVVSALVKASSEMKNNQLLKTLQMGFPNDPSCVSLDLFPSRIHRGLRSVEFRILPPAVFPSGLTGGESMPILVFFLKNVIWGRGRVVDALDTGEKIGVVELFSYPGVPVKEWMDWIPVFRKAGIPFCTPMGVSQTSLLVGLGVEVD